MKKTFLLLAALVIFITTSHAQLGKIKLPTNLAPNKLSESDIADGLKQALTIGSQNASQALNKTDGFNGNPFVRIPFPQDAEKLEKALRGVGYGPKVDAFIVSLNRAAEQAAIEAATIFANAIKSMTLTDAEGILKGADTAATHYLRVNTYSSLYDAFKPPITSALDNNNVNKQWTELTTLYNKMPFTKPVQTDLIAYTNTKALQGVFTTVAGEEKKIRTDPASQTTDLLKKVFGNQ